MADKPNYITLAHLRTAISALLNKIDTKPNEEDFANVAFSGDYSDLTNRPDLSDYVNWTTYSELAGYASSVASVNGILKGDGSGNITAATAGTDYQTPLPSQSGNASKFLTNDGSGNLSWDVGTWNGVSLAKQSSTYGGDNTYVPATNSLTPLNMSFTKYTYTPTANAIAKYDTNSYLYSTTPTATDNSTKVATTAFVKSKVESLGTVLNYKGTKATAAALPSSGNTAGDVWIVTEDNSEHVWNGSTWEEFGPTIDLSGYMEKGIDYVTAGAGPDNISLLGTKATAEGVNTLATGDYSHSEGYVTKAIGEEAHAEGAGSYAFGTGSHAEGQSTKAIGNYSHSEGTGFTTGDSFAISGSTDGVTYTYPSTYSFLTEDDLKDNILVITIGGTTITRPIYSADTTNSQITLYDPIDEDTVSVLSSQSCTIIRTNAKGNNSHTEGIENTASGIASHAEGINTIAKGDYSHTEGAQTIASGDLAHAEGYATRAESDNSHAEGNETTASGINSHAEGSYTSANGTASHTEGNMTIANGSSSHAEGYYTQANGDYSHAEGYYSSTYGSQSHAEGQGLTFTVSFNAPSGTTYPIFEGKPSDIYQNCPARILGETAEITGFGVSGGKISSITFDKTLENSQGYRSLQFYGTCNSQSHSEGLGTIAYDEAQHAGGKYNIPVTGAEVIGGGTSSTPANIRVLDWSGNETLAGKLTLGAGPVNNMDATTKQYVDTAIGNAASITMIDHSGPTTTQLNSLTINKLTQAQYNAISTPDPNQLYFITDDTIYAEKSYVDNLFANVDALPSQSGNSGKFLTTNGTTASWDTLNLSDYVPTSTTTSYGDGDVTNIIDNTGLSGYGNGEPCIELRSYYTEPDTAGENDSEAFLQINPYGISIGGNLSFEWGGLDASDLSSGTVNWSRLPTSRIYDATASRTANTVLAAPNGSAGAATFRALVAADIPSLPGSKISSAVANATTAASCSGNAATATTASSVSRATFGDSSNGTHDANSMTSNGLYYYSSNGPATSIGASTTDGAIYCQAYSTSWVGQIAQDYRDGDLFIRGKNNGTWQSWKRVWVTGDSVTGAVWNDYAEYRETDTQEFGRCVIENGDDTMSLSTQRLQKGCSITSDTWGFAQGKTEKAKTPIAVSGRVLAYPFENREEFKNHIGDAVCSGPKGTVSIMTDEEIQKYPLSIIGTISAVPDYEEWGGGSDRDPVKVNGRVWIRIK